MVDEQQIIEENKKEYEVYVATTPRQLDCYECLRKYRRWLTSEEIRKCIGYTGDNSRFKVGKFLRALWRFGTIERKRNNKCRRNEFVYRYKK
jgi:predicted transcriptional regulator